MGNMDAEAAPPSYGSLFGELQSQKSQSNGVIDYTRKATGMCCSKVAGVISIVIGLLCCIAFGLALPIAEIVIGSKFLKDCPSEHYLPIYLIVMGVFSIISGCSGGGSKAANRGEEESEDNKSTLGSCCNGLIGMFLFAWFICGNVWVFKMKECTGSVNPLNTTTDCTFTRNDLYSGTGGYCYGLVYDFVLYETIAKWAVTGVLMVFGCLCCCVMCCAYCCSSKE